MIKHLLLILVAFFSFSMELKAWGDGACGGAEWDFSESTGTLTIQSAEIAGFDKGVIVDYTDATKVPWYEYKDQIKKVVLNSDIKVIGQLVFYNLPNLTSVTFPSSLTTIGICAFQNCTSLETINLSSATSLTTIDYFAFGNCSKLSTVTLPNSVQTIGEQAFTNCKIASIQLPSNLTTIGSSAFFDCPISSLTIPAKVTSIGNNAFSPYNLTSISVNNSNTTYKEVNKCLVEKNSNSLILGNNLSTITIPSSISSVATGAFSGCSNITTLTLDGKTSLMYGAFSNCTGLKTINCNSETPSSYSNNSNSTYDTFGGITKKNVKVYVPGNSLTTYLSYNGGIWSEFDVYVRSGESAKFNLIFVDDDGTTQLATKEVEYRATINSSLYLANPIKEGHTFDKWLNVPSTMPAKDVTVKASYTVNSYTITYMVDNEQYGDVQTCEYGATVTPPATPTKTQHKFSGWSPSIPSTMPAKNLTFTGSFIPLGGDGIDWSLSEGDRGTLAITGSGAMYNYTSDSYVPWLQAAIGDGANGYYGITGITIAEGITTIGDYAFFKCNASALTTVILPNALKTIGKAAFAHCSGLTSITIPAKVTTIGADAFRRCSKLSSVTCLAINPPTLKRENGDEGVFAQIASGAKLYVPASSLTAYVNSSWKDYFDIYVIEGETVPTFTITFDTDGGSTVAPITQEYKTAVTAPANPTKEGYTFAGWDKTIPSTMPAGDMTIKAQWTAKTYTITFDTKGGSTVAPITQEYNTAVTAPAAPTRTGYTFAGWDKEIPANMPAGDMTITAQWKVNQYTIQFNSNGGSTLSSITQDYGTKITAPTNPTKEGYTFKGWNPALPATMPAKNETHTAQWTINKYTITFNTDGGSEIAAITQDYNTAVTAPANPTKTGYTFAGWDKAVPSTMPAENITITAKWKVNQYTINFDSNGGSAVSPITANYGAAITIPAEPTKEGHTFAGWEPALTATMPLNGSNHTAKWTVNQYTITFNTNGGSSVDEITANYGAPVTAPAEPTKEGHTFAGWEPALPSTMPLNGSSHTAKWTVNQYTITLNTDGGTTVENITADFGAAVTAPAEPTKEGHTFAGWEPALPATMPLNGSSHTAKWTVNQYTITFNTKGGSSVDEITADFGAAVTAPAEPTKEGHTFAGWDSEIPTTMPANNVTINANWTVNSYEVTYMVDGEQYGEKQTYEYGSDITPLAKPTKEGHTFSGWSGIPDTMPAENITVTGGFTVNTYKLTYVIDDEEYKSVDMAYGAEITPMANPVKEHYTFNGWNEDTPETMPAHDVVITGSYSYTPTIVDGTEFTLDEDKEFATLTYTRTLSKVNIWNALYVPFEIPVTAQFLEDYDVAYFNDIHSYDEYIGEKEAGVKGTDGKIDRMEMEVLLVQEGATLNANYPYLIRAKNENALDMNIMVENATLHQTVENTVSCSSVFMRFDVTGIYTTKTSGELKGEFNVYAMSGGGWKQALSDEQQLKPFRLYLSLTSIDGSPVKVAQSAMDHIRIRLDGEEETTGIDEIQTSVDNSSVIYDLQGRRVKKTGKGLYIVNGKKVFIK